MQMQMKTDGGSGDGGDGVYVGHIYHIQTIFIKKNPPGEIWRLCRQSFYFSFILCMIQCIRF